MARPVAVHYLVVLIGSLMVPWPVPAQRGSLGVSPRFGNHTRRPGGSSLSLLEVRAAYPRLHRDVYQLKLKFHKLQKDTKNELLALSEEVTNATSLFDSVDSLSEITQCLNKQLRRIRKNARKREQDQDLKLATLMSVIDGMKRQLTSAMTGVAPSSQLDDLSGRVHRQGEAIEALLAENADLRRESGSLSELLEVQREHFERLERWMNNSISGKARSPRVHGDSKHRKHDGVCNVKHYLHFPGSSPTDVASFGNNFPIALRAFSICFWLRTRAPYLGTILSYATSDNDNKLVLYGRNSSKTGLQLVIGDPEHRELPVDRLLGGSWHHVCIMWSAHGGRYAFYIDRRLAAAGSGLRQGYTIPSDGFLVLGQEQDLPGGGFESHESFVGNIAGFALWTRFLAPGEVSALATGRRMPMEGLILTLSDLAMVHGQVSLSECECLDDCL